MTEKRSTHDPLEIVGAGLSHQTLNPLGVICSNAEIMTDFTALLREEVEVSGSGEEVLTQLEGMSAEILDAARRVNRTIQSLRRLSNMGCHLIEQEIQLKELLEQMLCASESLELEIDEAAVVLGDRRALSQIVINLLDNAREVAQRVTLRVGVDGAWVWLTVEDDGPGIDAEEAPHIFKPFYSTEDLQRKQGMGLCEALLFAERMGGTLGYEGGSRFRLLLPAVT